ncbi:TlpA family protein disulfide reductase [Sphingobacterium yanglingense]|uniref:Cytochrome oxidase Cu insertion factor (SCO1/SenC/PrrC family) n=1 Tax=Sphingobacterium yanglingense TaxID=1437280 RepID=A0A4R6WHP6_9SPHI|nr:TlpA disulfide reductase family protein [Sphingobacterium yanglingense]TDQ79750.1 cytochrome oxidase Cu insertion factor (SCO1/SenC/PrrC family) [Sphingobacterium yanglingense]
MKYLKYITILFLLHNWIDTSAQQAATIVVKGVITEEPVDSIYLEVMVPMGTWSFPNSSRLYKAAWKEQGTEFRVETYDQPVYFYLKFGSRVVAGNLIETNDRLVVEIIGNELKYSGYGSFKNSLADRFRVMSQLDMNKLKLNDPKIIKNEYEIQDGTTLLKIEQLNSAKDSLSDILYSMMLADLIGENYNKTTYVTKYIRGGEMSPFIGALKKYRIPRLIVQIKKKLLKSENAAFSSRFTASLVQEYMFNSFFKKGLPFDYSQTFNHFLELPEGLLKERILFYLIYKNKRLNDAILSIEKGRHHIHNPLFTEVLQALGKAYSKKTSLQNYSLANVQGEKYNLSKLKGNVVVMDFWYTGCPACPEMVPHLYKLEQRFQGESVKFVSVSIDKDGDKWTKSVASGLYTTEEGLHLYTGGDGGTHPLIKDLFVTAYPTLLVFDKEGTITRIPRDPRLDDRQDLVELINELLFK